MNKKSADYAGRMVDKYLSLSVNAARRGKIGLSEYYFAKAMFWQGRVR